VRETLLAPAQLVLPLFVRDGKKVRRAVASMPSGVQSMSWSAGPMNSSDSRVASAP